jgi:hypothetical protein
MPVRRLTTADGCTHHLEPSSTRCMRQFEWSGAPVQEAGQNPAKSPSLGGAHSGALSAHSPGFLTPATSARRVALGNCTYATAGPGSEAKARPRVRSSTHSSQRLVSATCQPLQWSRSSAENSSPRSRPPDYDESSARRDHQASAAVIALSASWMPSPTSPAVAAQCKGTRARAPGSQRCSSRVSGSGAVPS